MEIESTCFDLKIKNEVKKIRKIDEKREMKRKRKILRAISISISQEYIGMKLFGDLLISTDGSLRLCCFLHPISFGCSLMIGYAVEYNKLTNCINIKLKKNDFMPTCTLQQAKILVNNQLEGIQISILFEELNKKVEKFIKEMEQHQLSKKILEEREEEFQEFCSYCFEYLKNLNCDFNNDSKQSSDKIHTFPNHTSSQQCYETKQSGRSILFQKNKPTEITKTFEQFHYFQIHSQDSAPINQRSPLGMFTYSIGRLNWQEKDIQIVYSGYSKGYLDFIGLDEESLITLTLRQKKMDLMRNKRDITNYSTFGLFERINGKPSGVHVSLIVTFDGFPIKIYQQTIRLQLPDPFKENLQARPEYLFIITDIDVDITDLQNLIKYRQQLVNSPKSLSMDILIQKELSYRLEDIEYSFHSESFMDKYYHENLLALKKLENCKESSINTCKYKLLKKEEELISMQTLFAQ